MDTVYKDKCRVKSVEFEVRELDQYGDSQDVNHFETKDEAIKFADKLVNGGAIAAVVEKHTSKRPAYMFEQPDKFETIITYGRESALLEGGWKKS